jgi:hypothetical protein
MKISKMLVAACALFMAAGCAIKPQQAISLSEETMNAQSGRVGVMMTKLPAVDTHLPGAGCLLCLAAAAAANSGLTAHAKTLSYEDLPQLKDEVAKALAKKGVKAVVIQEALDLDSLASYPSDGQNAAAKDFSSLKKKYEVDKLLVINITMLGFERPYSAYIPTSDPKGVFRGAGYIVNLSNNRYEWYQPVQVLKAADKQWDEAPKFPGLTNAYFQALELGKDGFLKPFNF